MTRREFRAAAAAAEDTVPLLTTHLPYPASTKEKEGRNKAHPILYIQKATHFAKGKQKQDQQQSFPPFPFFFLPPTHPPTHFFR